MMRLDQVQKFCAFLVTNRYITAETLSLVLQEFKQSGSTSRRLTPLHQAETTPRAGAILIVQMLAQSQRWLGQDCEPIALAEQWCAQEKVEETVSDPRPSGRQPTFKKFGTMLAPARIGDFDIEKPLGEGGMGCVFLARNRHTGLRVALKMMAEDLPSKGEQDPERLRESRERFRREAIACMSLSSPHVVRGFHLGEEEEIRYLVMELIAGQELGKYVQTLAKDDAATIIRLTRDACRGIAAFHDKGFIHRDVKPANVMVDASGCPKVIDSGLVRSVSGADVAPAQIAASQAPTDAELTNNAVLGTPMYMAPEQAMGLPVGKPADVYSLGKVLVFLLTGKHIHEGRTPVELFRKVMTNAPLPAAIVDAIKHRLPFGGASKRMLAIVEKALAFEPADRYQDAGSLAEALEGFLTWQQERKEQEAAAQAEALENERAAAEKQRLANRKLFIALGVACVFSIMLLLLSIFFASARKEAEARAKAETEAARSAREAESSARAAETEAKLRAEIGSGFLECQALMRSCKWTEAETALLALLAKDERYEAAHYALAQVQFNLRKHECVQQWQWLIEHGTESRRSEYAFNAIFYGQQLKPSETDAPYQALLQRISDPRYVGLARAEIAFTVAEQASRRVSPSEAVAQMNAALALVPAVGESDDLAWLDLAVRGGITWRISELTTGVEQAAKRQEARTLLQQSIARNPDFPMTWFWLASILRANGEHAATIAAFERLEQLMPNWGPPRYLKADEQMSVASVVNANDPPDVIERKVNAAMRSAEQALATCNDLLRTFRMDPRQIALCKMTMLNALTLRFSLQRRKRQVEAAEQTRDEIYRLGDELLNDATLPDSERAAATAILEQVRSRK